MSWVVNFRQLRCPWTSLVEFAKQLYLNVTIAVLCLKMSSVLSYNHFKVKLGMFLTGHTVAVVTYCVKKMTIT